MTNPDPQLGARTEQIKASDPVAQFISILVVLALIAIGFVIFIPLAIIVITLAVLFYAYIRLRLFLNRTRAPNGPLDGRRNVRVMDRDE